MIRTHEIPPGWSAKIEWQAGKRPVVSISLVSERGAVITRSQKSRGPDVADALEDAMWDAQEAAIAFDAQQPAPAPRSKRHKAPAGVEWRRLDFGHDRRKLWLDGEETPFFMDVAKNAAHRHAGKLVGVYLAGAGEGGCALRQGAFHSIREAQRFAIQQARTFYAQKPIEAQTARA